MLAIKIKVLCFSLVTAIGLCRTLQLNSSVHLSKITTIGQNTVGNCTAPMIIDDGIIQLGNCDDLYYTIPLQIGTPSQLFNAIVSTASNQLIVQAQTGTQSGFNMSESQTLQMTNNNLSFTMFDNIAVETTEAFDRFRINESAELTAEMYITTDNVMNSYAMEQIYGQIGIGLQQANCNILFSMNSEGYITTSAYTVSLQKGDSPSYFYYNQIPEEIISNTISIEISSNNPSSLEVIGLSIGDLSLQGFSPQDVIISSAMPYFLLPYDYFQKIISNYFKGCLSTINGMSCDCNNVSSWPTVSVMFRGIQVYIVPENYMVVLADGTCSYGFTSTAQGSKQPVVLGTSLFYGYNITFDVQMQTIGFQGELSSIQIVDFTFFEFTLYFLISFILAILGYAIFLVWYMRVSKHGGKNSRLTQISLSTRFLDTS